MSRTRRFSMNVSNEELAMLKALAEAEGLDQADVLRGYIRKRYAEAGPAPLARAQQVRPIA
jgi:hypothetical protein